MATAPAAEGVSALRPAGPVVEADDGIALGELPPGHHAVVVDVDASGGVGRRLLDLGLLPGTPVRALRRAPLGDPTVYELRGYRLCLRDADAARVRVKPAPADAPA